MAVNTSSRYALIALQGPAARDVLQTLTGVDLADDQVLLVHDRRGGQRPRHDLAHRLHGRGRLRGVRAAGVGRTRVGRDPRRPASGAGVVPAGLGARDTLRLEAAMRLYGNDMDETTTVVEADLGLDRRLEEGRVPRRRRAAAPEGRRRRAEAGRASRCSTARSRGTATTSTSTAQKAGVVTSGTQTPFLKKAIGMAYVPVGSHGPRHRVRDRRPRPPRPRAGRADAVLQASEVAPWIERAGITASGD